jgi:N-acetylmuramoyl-L-alanine amidase
MARPPQRHGAATPWEQAERGREELEAMPPETRTRADYTAAMDRFRDLYHESPRDLHAAASVYAVAELLAEQGRTLHDAKSLKASVGQYEFLRKQYPGSGLRIAALLAEAQIEAIDLGDEAAAKERYKLLLKQYPRSEQAEEARAGLDSFEAGVARAKANGSASVKAGAAKGEASAPIAAAPKAAAAVPVAASAVAAQQAADGPGERGAAHPEETIEEDAAIPSPLDGNAAPAAAHRPARHAGTGRTGPPSQVKGIRHWSTPTYTRVAIDLGDDVQFEAARVPHPDRIYFDLHNTRLAQELVGKSFAVTDDGFLKRIRAAQFSDNMTRVVLDVNDVSEYSAFLLPNPYRLIIDIHGGTKTTGPATGGAAPATQTHGQEPDGGVPRNSASSLPSTPLTSGKPAGPPGSTAPAVPNTVAVRSANTTEVASLSQQPGKVEATTRPTSQPISAVVAANPEVNEPAQAAGANPIPTTARSKGAMDGAPGRSDRTSSDRTSSNRTRTKGSDGMAAGDAVPARAAVPTADGSTSLVRALGLKIGRIVIDAGHGGHDSGTIGADGIEEKDVVLDVALRLGKLLNDRLGAEIVYTRSDDTFIPLETRTAIANKAQADLFISIHANSSADPSARGVETYYLNFTTSPDALETAARENAVSNQSIHQLSDLVKKITLRDKIDESREFASDVEESLYSGLQKGNAGLKNRGVKKAPFVVLIGANMPSILAEISFVTNPRDASELLQPEYRERVAESLYKGIARYEAGLSGVKPSTLRASVSAKPASLNR